MSKLSDKRLLIVDDDEDILLTARIALKPYFQQITVQKEPHSLPDLFHDEQFDIVLLDMNFTSGFTSGKEGLRWLKKIKKMSPESKVILMTAYGEINLAVKAMKEGASDFVLKPWENEVLIKTIESMVEEPEAKESVGRKNVTRESGTTQMIGDAPLMQEVFRMIDKVAPTQANVLILGENGTGKELVASALHEKSKRANEPFIHVDLGAISEHLFESELFGHVKGAFTDAYEDREGRFEAANGGTLFLDEIGNLSAPLQAKLLSALQNRKIQRVGSHKSIDVDIRLISATNMPLYQMVREKTFRQDLLYRINTVEITLPPLRSRVEDIPLLVDYFVEYYCGKYHMMSLDIGKHILEPMQAYSWPGNVRELQHLVERAVIMEDPEILMPVAATHDPPGQLAPEQKLNLEEVEREAIRKAIQKHQGNISKAARELGLGRTTLYRKMEKYGL